MDTTNFDEAAELRARLAEVTAERDELLAALEGLCAMKNDDLPHPSPQWDAAYAAIAAAKGEA